jgi:hypothetical protein
MVQMFAQRTISLTDTESDSVLRCSVFGGVGGIAASKFEGSLRSVRIAVMMKVRELLEYTC